jgi:hypothetical protein
MVHQRNAIMKRLAMSLTMIAIAHGTAQAEPRGGKEQADGSTRYDMEFGSVLARPDGTIQLTLPDSNHLASIGLPEFTLENADSKPGGVMFLTNPNAQGFIVSGYFEKVRADSTVACRELYFSYALKSPVPKSEVKRYEKDGKAIGTYVIAEMEGQKLNQRHQNTYAYADGYCLDLHVSKAFFDEKADGELMQQISKSVVITPK